MNFQCFWLTPLSFWIFKHFWIVIDWVEAPYNSIVLDCHSQSCLTSPRSRWPDRSDPWSDDFRAHTCSRCARITWSGKGFERTFVWTLAWSEATLFWDGLIRGPTCLGRSDQRRFRARPQPGPPNFHCFSHKLLQTVLLHLLWKIGHSFITWLWEQTF